MLLWVSHSIDILVPGVQRSNLKSSDLSRDLTHKAMKYSNPIKYYPSRKFEFTFSTELHEKFIVF